MTLKAYRDHSMMFKGRVRSLRANYPPQKSAVKLTNSKAIEVRQTYLVCSVTVTEHDGSSWVFCSPDEGCNVLLPNLKWR